MEKLMQCERCKAYKEEKDMVEIPGLPSTANTLMAMANQGESKVPKPRIVCKACIKELNEKAAIKK